MELAINNVIRLILYQSFLGQTMLNVFHFRVPNLNGGIFDLEDITQSWFVNYKAIWAGGQYVAATQTSVKAINLSQPNQPFFQFVFTQAGINGGTALPSNVSASFKMLVSTNKTKAGSKRYGGLTTAQVTGNVLSAGGLSSLEPIREMLATDMLVDNDTETDVMYLRRIVLKNYTTEFPTENDYQDVTGCVLSPNVGSQNSRKVGYGS